MSVLENGVDSRGNDDPYCVWARNGLGTPLGESASLEPHLTSMHRLGYEYLFPPFLVNRNDIHRISFLQELFVLVALFSLILCGGKLPHAPGLISCGGLCFEDFTGSLF